MRRRLNHRLLLCLLAMSLMLGIGVHFLHGFQVRQNASALLQQADRVEKEGQLDRAVQYLENYLALRPADTDALARYGQALVKLATSPRAHLRAYLVLEQVLLRDPDRHDVRRQAVRSAMGLVRVPEALGHLKVLREAFPEDHELLLLTGQCHELGNNFQEAETWYRKGYEQSPEIVDAYVGHARVLRRRLDRPAEARKVMELLVEKNPRSFQAHLAMSFFLREAGSPEESEKALAAARQLAPDEAAVIWAVAELARSKDDREQARAELRRGLKLHPKDRRMYASLAEVETRADRPTEATACLRRAVEALPEDAELWWLLADSLIAGEGGAEAAKIMDRLRRGGYPAPLVDFLQARLHARSREWQRAVQALERLQAALGRWPDVLLRAELLLAHCHERAGDFDQQLAVCQRVLALEPGSVAAAFGSGSALAALGNTDQAILVFRKLGPKVPEARLALARLLLRRNRGRPEGERAWQELDDLLNEAEKASPGSTRVAILRAEVHALKGKWDEARAALEAARDRSPDAVDLWVALASLADRRGKGAALAVLAEAEKRLGDQVELRLARAAYWARRGGDEAKGELTELLENAGGFAGEDRERLWRGLAAARARVGDTKGSMRLWRKLAQERPDALDAHLALFDLALQSEDEGAVREALDGIKAVQGDDGVFWRYGRACYLVWRASKGDTSGLDEARALLNLVEVKRPGWSRVAVCRAHLHDLTKDQAGAAREYLRAIDLGERDPAVIQRAAELLFNRRRYVEADQVIRKLPEAAAAGEGLQRLAAQVAFQTDDPARALQLQQAVAKGSRDFRDHLWLGQILWAMRKPVEAEAALRRAVKLADDAPDARVALVQFLARTGQKEKAATAIEEARGKFPAREAALALAQCFEAVGQGKRAEAQYRAALAARPEDVAALQNVASFYLRAGRRREAEPHLQKLIRLQIKEPEAARWARNVLALVLATSGDYRRSSEALKLAGILDDSGAPVPADGDTTEQLRLKAIVLTAQRGSRPRGEAIRLLEQVVRRPGATPDDRLLLAQLYQSAGEWPRARDQLLALVASDEDNPRYLAAYARGLLLRREAAAARPRVERLKKLEPDSFRTVELEARLLAAEGKENEAAKVLLNFSAGKKAPQLLAVARLLERLGLGEAEETYRRFVKESGRPESSLVLAGYLGRVGNLQEALDLCERAWATCAPPAVSATCIDVLYAGDAGAESLSRVERWLRSAVEKDPKDVALVMQLAALRNLQGDYREAERIYLGVLGKEPRNVLALNNLAWLLAFQEDRRAEALTRINEAVRLAGPLSGLLDTRGVIHWKLGSRDLAASDLEEAVKLGPTPESYFHLAQARLALGKREAAEEALRQALGYGLTPAGLHPLERQEYKRLRRELRLDG